MYAVHDQAWGHQRAVGQLGASWACSVVIGVPAAAVPGPSCGRLDVLRAIATGVTASTPHTGGFADPGTRDPSEPTLQAWTSCWSPKRRARHVQVREYVRSLVTGAQYRVAGAQRARARAPVRRRPDDGAAGDDALVVEGLLERIPGRGTFVARWRRAASRLTSYTEGDAAASRLSRRRCSPWREQAGPGVARALNLTEGDAVIHWRAAARADGTPMCVEDAYSTRS